MQQVDFYILGEQSGRNILQMVCQLCEKALSQKLSVVICTQSIDQAHELDEILWCYKPESFIAHEIFTPEISNHHFNYPVLIYASEQQANNTVSADYHDLLINLSHSTPNNYQEFERLAELVDNDKQHKELARNRYRHYRDQGLTIHKHDL
jgi:DNA polymerase-3 subunit chi